MIEVVEEINCVERRVGSRTVGAGEVRVAVIARAYGGGAETRFYTGAAT